MGATKSKFSPLNDTVKGKIEHMTEAQREKFVKVYVRLLREAAETFTQDYTRSVAEELDIQEEEALRVALLNTWEANQDPVVEHFKTILKGNSQDIKDLNT